MKKVYLVLIALTVLGVSGDLASAQRGSNMKKRIVGTWKLVFSEHTMSDGSTRPYPQYGPNGKGFLMYTQDGYMCANLLNPDRVKWADPKKPTAEENVAKAEASNAYCGRYEVDEKLHQLIHLPEVSTIPGYAGTRQIRPYSVDGERLVLSDLEKEIPGVVRWRIVWEKVK
jgi:hypothetical protein